MDKSNVLWVDLRVIKEQESLSYYLTKRLCVSCKNNIERLGHRIRAFNPAFICFEFDFPDISSLKEIRRIKHMFPALPMILLTEQHSETLAIWALKIHVWDYFVKPVKTQELLDSISLILDPVASKASSVKQSSHHYLPFNPLPPETRIRFKRKKKTAAAKSYIEMHFHEKIKQKKLAQLCGMNCTTFSRLFKKENSITFRDYLVNYRIKKARELLQNPQVTVTDIAYTVGFNDPSYFTRVFKRVIGMSPSEYRSEKLIRAQ